MTKEEQELYDEIMDEVTEEAARFQANFERVYDRIFKTLRSCMGKMWIQDLESYLSETGGIVGLSFRRKPYGDYQDEGYKYMEGVWIDQVTGPLGDDFSGTISVKLRRDKFLIIEYAC